MSQFANTDERFLLLAESVADLSDDPVRKVGAVMVTSRNTIHVGTNTLLPGTPRLAEAWNRPLDYDFIVTAEENVIRCVGTSDAIGATLYLSMPPSTLAVKTIVLSGIKRLVFRGVYDSQIVQRTHEKAACILRNAAIELAEVPAHDSHR